MSDDEVDQFYDWLNSVNIELIDETDADDLDDDDYLASRLIMRNLSVCLRKLLLRIRS